MTDTERVRLAIPEILKEVCKEGMTFNELFNELGRCADIGPRLYDSNGEPRVGILRGITNKLETIPIPNVIYVKKDGSMKYVYTKNALSELKALSEEFISNIRTKELLAIDVFTLSSSEAKVYKKYQEILLELNEINQEEL